MPIVSEKEIEFKVNFHYEFFHRGGHSEEDHYKRMMNVQISKCLMGKNWKLIDNTDSKKCLYGNLFSVSTYVLSLCLASKGCFDEVIKLLKPTIKQCNQNPQKYGDLISVIRNRLLVMHHFRFNIEKWNLNVKKMKEYAEEMHRLGKYNYSALLAMSIVSELQGDRESAKSYTLSAEMSAPKNNIIHKFNHLYFYLNEEQYEKAVEVLDELATKIHDTEVEFIIKFLYDKYEKTDELALLFDIGMIRFIWADKKSARKELNDFIKKARVENESKYKILIDKALEVIK